MKRKTSNIVPLRPMTNTPPADAEKRIYYALRMPDGATLVVPERMFDHGNTREGVEMLYDESRRGCCGCRYELRDAFVVEGEGLPPLPPIPGLDDWT